MPSNKGVLDLNVLVRWDVTSHVFFFHRQKTCTLDEMLIKNLSSIRRVSAVMDHYRERQEGQAISPLKS